MADGVHLESQRPTNIRGDGEHAEHRPQIAKEFASVHRY